MIMIGSYCNIFIACADPDKLKETATKLNLLLKACGVISQEWDPEDRKKKGVLSRCLYSSPQKSREHRSAPAPWVETTGGILMTKDTDIMSICQNFKNGEMEILRIRIKDREAVL